MFDNRERGAPPRFWRVSGYSPTPLGISHSGFGLLAFSRGAGQRISAANGATGLFRSLVALVRLTSFPYP